ncbi:MAG: family 43 glycosylhydrolase [Terriglobia bacterium]
MPISRRTALKAAGWAGLGLTMPKFARASAEAPVMVVARGNPIIPGRGACDPQVRVYDDHVYMYATHDALPKSTDFVMNDWWVWHSTDLVQWELVSILKPEQTYFGKPSTQCWATDGARRNGKYYFYFSMGPENIGVVEGDSPAGPWRDPLGHALIAKGSVPTESRDPGIFQEPDGTSFIVFGTFDYYLARLHDDMTSLAEAPRLIPIENKEGPYGKGRTDDKPFLHRRGGKYYLSWGCYYAVSDSLYGPYNCKGSIIKSELVSPEFLDPTNRTSPYAPPPQGAPQDWLGYDRHGSFFQLYGQWYFICNDQALPGSNTYFRNSVISYVRYKENGDIDPIRLTPIGVGQYDANHRIEATDYFQAVKARVAEADDGRFQVRDLRDGSYLVYPKIRNLRQRPRLSISASSIHADGLEIDIRRGGPAGPRLAKLAVKPPAGGAGESKPTATLNHVRDTDDLCLVFRGGPGELIRLNRLEFN